MKVGSIISLIGYNRHDYNLISVERYSHPEHGEIKLQLPPGESFILASKVREDRYEVCVLLPWYGKQFYTGIDSTVIYDELKSESWQGIMNAPTSDLMAIIQRSLPLIKQLNQGLDFEI